MVFHFHLADPIEKKKYRERNSQTFLNWKMIGYVAKNSSNFELAECPIVRTYYSYTLETR